METPNEERRKAKILVCLAEAAEMLSISQRTMWSLADQGSIPRVRIGRSVRFDVADLRRFAESRKSESSK